MAHTEEHVLGLIDRVKAKPLRFRDEQITMAHGAGGKATLTLIEGLLAPAFGIDELADAAPVGDLAVTTDSFVVKPIRFPGGSIGELAVNGTVNDLAVRGARPLWDAVDALLDAAGPSLRCLRDATRGGVASVLNELARASEVAVVVREAQVPVRPAVVGACEIL